MRATTIVLITLIALFLNACAVSPEGAPEADPGPADAPVTASEPDEPSAPPAPASREPAPEAVDVVPEEQIEIRDEPSDAGPSTAQPSERDARPEAEPREAEFQAAESQAAEPRETEPREAEPFESAGAQLEPESRPEPQPTSQADTTAALSGTIRVLRNGREQAHAAATHLNNTIVAWRPESPVGVEPMTQQQIMTRQSQFFPQVLAITSGTSVRFPNMDDIQHNVFSLTEGHRFDVGLYGPDEGEVNRFEGAGMVELFCNVHPRMAAFVLVLDTPFFTRPGADGEFQLGSLPSGPGELLIWNFRAEDRFQRHAMNLGDDAGAFDAVVDITRPTVPQHTNKHGESYSRGR